VPETLRLARLRRPDQDRNGHPDRCCGGERENPGEPGSYRGGAKDTGGSGRTGVRPGRQAEISTDWDARRRLP